MLLGDVRAGWAVVPFQPRALNSQLPSPAPPTQFSLGTLPSTLGDPELRAVSIPRQSPLIKRIRGVKTADL